MLETFPNCNIMTSATAALSTAPSREDGRDAKGFFSAEPPSFYGYLDSEEVAAKIFESARNGMCNVVRKRLHRDTSDIKAGQGYIYDTGKSC
jgi:hypothetical protein